MPGMTQPGAPIDVRADEAYAAFIARYPSYAQTAALDRLRATEYRRLDDQHQA